MAEASRFVHIVDEVPELAGRTDGPVLVHALDGFLDAGNAANLAAKHLLSPVERPGRREPRGRRRSTTTAPGARR